MKTSMTKLDQLWIRACKSSAPEVRLYSVYRRFYIPILSGQGHITNILTRLVDDYTDTCHDHVYTESIGQRSLQPELTPSEVQLNVMKNVLRYTSRADLPGLTAPIMFRRHETPKIRSEQKRLRHVRRSLTPRKPKNSTYAGE